MTVTDEELQEDVELTRCAASALRLGEDAMFNRFCDELDARRASRQEAAEEAAAETGDDSDWTETDVQMLQRLEREDQRRAESREKCRKLLRRREREERRSRFGCRG